MKAVAAVSALVSLLAVGVNSFALRAHTQQDPDTSCGKGFDNLVQGSKDYYFTAVQKLWTHPYHLQDKDVFEQELQCWFANMATTKCGGLASQAEKRKSALVEKCTSVEPSWRDIWDMFSEEEVKWFKANYPAETEEESEIFYKQAMETAKEVDKKELLCMTLFTIDDNCVTYSYIRMQ
mmetsp:Transcript_52769/g.126038  ORF Transcript_52769/g.126038 Transcript_52769/m.126038 type:complete len:179 (+) Transcript_52769:87-623(+)|eukprot:CAMPEP_0178433274 /NCGR_PEP_ID=MMETSP0689_2-20121128/32820_1 /TAXON_ID=160604 /ORGANISM="Amphidinium massartii, Strain CS-259" /LENGTH=178 /DNA_ID=CAMNT_0020055295 /DNA_START=84 /DNA_END=620 /DNA_ORIENTATION=+